ncbi:MAG: GTP 3',8-cyclase MoaA [Parasynechococcus sp.]|uniref:GTP 3',8-cyclase MoaA n=1 Tax=Parasynechococcus sp. TaxID=3101203 RepID=UPI003885C771|tara:strand:- start:40 stop:1083 length:1044 start_codon:yes stop_codon:yes gene_type:complete
MTSEPSVADQRSRTLGVLRLSLTARCNLSCPYCCPDAEDPPGLLSLEQQLRLIRVACRLGVHTLRLTGGEPLLSDRLLPLLQQIHNGRETLGDPLNRLREVALTSNGVLLTSERATALRASGLDRITVSLDAVDPEVAARMAGLRGGVPAGERLLQQVFAGLQAATSAGFDPAAGGLKLNAVIQRTVNDDQLIPLADLARRWGLELRLIEFMDVGNRNGWRPQQVLPAAEMVKRIGARWPLQPLGRPVSGTARSWRYADGGGCLGVIASISEPFCSDCNRLRVTADGRAFTCLFAAEGTDLTPVLDVESDLERTMAALWHRRSDRYSEERHGNADSNHHAEMAYLGG